MPEDANIDDADDDEEEQDQGGPPTLQSNSVSSAKRKQPDVDSDDAPPQRSAVRIKKTKRTVKFVMGWLTKKAYKDWLVFDVGTNRMVCSFCKKHDKEGVWATCCKDNFRYFYVNNYMKKKNNIALCHLSLSFIRRFTEVLHESLCFFPQFLKHCCIFI